MKNRDLTVVYLTMLVGLTLFSFRCPAVGHPSGQPATLTAGPAPINQKRYVGLTIFNFEADARIDQERIEHSAQAGCNSVEITINWDHVYPTRQSAANWKIIDSHVQTALRLNLKIALRIYVGREMSKLGGFWGENETMQAADGSRMTGSGLTQFSFAHQPTVELAKNFVRESMQRYRYLQDQNQLLFISVVASPALESEFSPVHHKADGTKYVVAFDYSEPMKQAYRQWLQGRFSLANLNKRWNTDFGDWSAVVPPPNNASNPHGIFSANRRGQDWYVFRHRLLERFLNEMTNTIKSVHGSIRVVNQHGAVWDRLSGLRATYAFKSLNRTADGLKFNDGPTYNHRFSMDVARSNLNPGAFMINAVDGMFYKDVSIGTYFDQVKECFDHGASMLTLANFGADAARPVLTQLIKRVVDAGLLDQPVTVVQTGSTTSYKLSEILKDHFAPINTRWTEQYNNSGKKPVQITLIEDLLDESDEPVQPDINQAPQVIKSFGNQQATVGKPFSVQMAESHFNDPDGTITRIEVTGLPAGLTYNAGTRLISGTPTSAVTVTIAVKATDNDGASVTDWFQLTVKPAGNTVTKPGDDDKPVEVVTGNFEGYLDKVECGTIRGWVWDRNRPNSPITVEFFADGRSMGTVDADIFRTDLLSAGKGNGSHAYSFTTPSSLKDGKTREISAKVLNSDYTLKWAPKELTCPSSGRWSAETAEQKLAVTVLGNPVSDQFAVDVRGAEGQPVDFLITDIRGRIVETRQVGSAGATEQQRFRVAREQPGLLLLRVSSGLQSATIKVLKQ